MEIKSQEYFKFPEKKELPITHRNERNSISSTRIMGMIPKIAFN